jgi:hypothetical protein
MKVCEMIVNELQCAGSKRTENTLKHSIAIAREIMIENILRVAFTFAFQAFGDNFFFVSLQVFAINIKDVESLVTIRI